MQDTKYFSLTLATSYAFRTYFKNWSFFGVISLILFCITLGLDFFKISLKNISFESLIFLRSQIPYEILFISISWIIVFLYFAFLNKVFLANFDNQLFRLSNFFNTNFNNLIRYLSTSFVYYLGVLAAASPILIIDHIVNTQTNIWFYQFLILATAFFLLLLPCITLFSNYLFADYFALEKKLSLVQNFTASADLTYGQITKMVLMFYVVGLISAVVCVAISALFFFTLLIVFSPIRGLASYYNWSDSVVFLPLQAFGLFLQYGFIWPLIFLMKLSIYKQLLNHAK